MGEVLVPHQGRRFVDEVRHGIQGSHGMPQLLLDDGPRQGRLVHADAMRLDRGEHAVLAGGKVDQEGLE